MVGGLFGHTRQILTDLNSDVVMFHLVNINRTERENFAMPPGSCADLVEFYFLLIPLWFEKLDNSSRFREVENTPYEDDIYSLPPWNFLRGKKNDKFFPFPEGYFQQFSRPRSTRIARSSSRETAQEVNIPWEMRYFSPMLRGWLKDSNNVYNVY